MSIVTDLQEEKDFEKEYSTGLMSTAEYINRYSDWHDTQIKKGHYDIKE